MWFVMLLAVILGTCHVAGVTHIAFQAAAHLFMGGLAVAWWKEKERCTEWRNLVVLFIFVGLTVLETICFFMGVGRTQ